MTGVATAPAASIPRAANPTVASLTAAAAIAPLVWGSTYIVTTELLPPDRPMTASVLRAIPAGLILLAIAPGMPRPGWRLKTIALGILNIGAFFPLLFIAASRLPGGTAAVVGSLQPLIIGGLSTGLGWHRPPAKQMLWSSIAVVGVAMITLTGRISIDPFGLAAAIAGTTSMAGGLLLTRRWRLPPDVSPLNSTAWQLLIGGTLIIPLIGVYDVSAWPIDGAAILGYTWLTVVGAAVAYAVWLRGARSLPSTNMALLGLLSPLTAAALGWIILDQSMSALQSLGFVTALVGSIAGQLHGQSR